MLPFLAPEQSNGFEVPLVDSLLKCVYYVSKGVPIHVRVFQVDSEEAIFPHWFVQHAKAHFSSALSSDSSSSSSSSSTSNSPGCMSIFGSSSSFGAGRSSQNSRRIASSVVISGRRNLLPLSRVV